MNAPEYLDALRVELDLPSDYALAGELGLSREYVSQLRLRKRPLSTELALKFAQILGKRPSIVLLDAQLDKAKTQVEREAWEEIAEGFHAPLPRAERFAGHSLRR